MVAAQPGRRAAVIAASDLPDSHRLLVSGHEDCDCACPVSPDRARPADRPWPMEWAGSHRWICGPDVMESELDADHWLLFYPLGSGGVVVVNGLAHRIFRCFARPTALADAATAVPGGGDEVAGIV